jgi:DNA polymerase-3 subunit delta
MKIRAEKLTQHLDQQLLPSYLISGGESLLVQEATDRVRATATQRGFSERMVFDVDANFDWNQVHAEVGALSLFSTKKILEIRIASGKPGDKGARALIDICANSSPDDLLLVVLPKLERSAQNSRWLKALDALGGHVDIWPIGAAQLPKWIQQRLRAANIDANQGAVEVLADRVEGNLLAASQEIEKLKLLALDGRVDATIMSAVVADSTRYNLYDLIDKMLAGDAQSAARTLRGLHGEGSQPLPILWAISRELRKLLNASERLARGERVEQALEQAGVWRKQLPIMRAALQRCRPAHLRMLIYQAGAVDRGVKGLREADIWDELTTLTLSLAGSPTLSPQNIKHLVES